MCTKWIESFSEPDVRLLRLRTSFARPPKIRQLTLSWAEQLPKPSLAASMYMDDFLSSEPDTLSAVSKVNAVTELVSRRGFRLTKWLSNYRDVLAEVPVSERVPSTADLSKHLPTERLLGLMWDTELDLLKLQVQQRAVPATKRGVLQMAASIYDPLGLAAPFTLLARIVMQKLWSQKLDWDHQLIGTCLEEWTSWMEELPFLNQLTVPRSLREINSPTHNQQLHIFCDASELGFGAVAYLRETPAEGTASVSFVMSKARVAPLRKMTIVRLETQAAVLAVRLADVIRR